jgi:hypothetical protein
MSALHRTARSTDYLRRLSVEVSRVLAQAEAALESGCPSQTRETVDRIRDLQHSLHARICQIETTLLTACS